MNLNTNQAEILVIFSFANNILNLVLLFLLNMSKGKKELISELKEELEAKGTIIKSLKEERRQLRFQYNQTLAEKVHLQGELKTYHNIHQLPIAQQ